MSHSPSIDAAGLLVRTSAGAWDETDARRRFRVSGRDRVKFLQNMTSQDVKSLAPGEAALTCALSVKAKLVGIARILARPDDFLLDVEAGCAEALIAHLRKYVVVNQVAFEETTAATAALAVEGPEAEARLAALGAAASIAPITISGERGARVYLERARRDAALAALSAGGAPLPPEAVEALRVEGGVPAWGKELDETTFPPEANLDRTAISYTKGCFLGQEPIARLHFMGHLNRRLQGLVLAEGATLPPPGAKLRGPDGKDVGRLTSAAPSPSLGRLAALGYVRKEVQAPGTKLTAFTPDGTWTADVEVRELPLVAPTAPPPAKEKAPAGPPPKAAGGVTPGGSAEGGLMLPGRT